MNKTSCKMTITEAQLQKLIHEEIIYREGCKRIDEAFVNEAGIWSALKNLAKSAGSDVAGAVKDKYGRTVAAAKEKVSAAKRYVSEKMAEGIAAAAAEEIKSAINDLTKKVYAKLGEGNEGIASRIIQQALTQALTGKVDPTVAQQLQAALTNQPQQNQSAEQSKDGIKLNWSDRFKQEQNRLRKQGITGSKLTDAMSAWEKKNPRPTGGRRVPPKKNA